MFKVAIGNTVRFQIKIGINDKGVKRDFSLWLEGKRVSVDDLKANMEENGDMKVIDFQIKVCRDNLTGWSDQRLVLGEDDQPVDFSLAALDLMLNMTGVAPVIHSAYMAAVEVSDEKAGRAKN